MTLKEIKVPDMGDFSDVPVIEIYVNPGDMIEKDAPLIALESAKAVTDIPSPFKGRIKELLVNEGERISAGAVIASIETEDTPIPAVSPKPEEEKSSTPAYPINFQKPGDIFHAAPSVRRIARERGISLEGIKGSGPNGRILKEDIDGTAGGMLSKILPLTRIQKISGPRLTESIKNIPHVTQFDKSDVTELEKFRRDLEQKISILPFIIKAVARALQEYPEFNSSLAPESNGIILHEHCNIGVAVNTPEGLIVPVIHNTETKSVLNIARELVELAERARNGKSGPEELRGATFSVSSLGGIGGTAFTPIINPPEAAILGVSKIRKEPVWDGEAFIPADVLPLSLSYDHRIIDGAKGAEFTAHIAGLLNDVRRILL